MTDGGSGRREEIADKDISILSNLENAETIYIDGMQGVVSTFGTVRIGLYQFVQDIQKSGEPAEIKKLIVGRLVMSTETLMSVSKWLAERAQELEQQKETDDTKTSISSDANSK